MTTRSTKFDHFDRRFSPQQDHGAGAGSERRAMVDENIESVIGQELRSLYGDVLSEPVPQRFVDLLENLVKEADQ